MPIWDGLTKITKNVEQGAKIAVKKANESVEIGKIRREITDSNEKITRIFIQIGKSVYENYKNQEIPDDTIVELCEKIDTIKSEIAEKEEKILLLKNLKKCPSCNSMLELNIQYCPQCGQKQEMFQKEQYGSEYTENTDLDTEEQGSDTDDQTE